MESNLQKSHSKILLNLSKNFQDFKEDIRELQNAVQDDEDHLSEDNEIPNVLYQNQNDQSL